jgi:hypothetical protein
MKNTVNVVMFLALSVCMAACASDIKRTTTPDGFTVSRVNTAKATVVEIDHEKHTAVLKDKNGRQVINVGPDAPNFGKIQVGDTVVAEVIESVRVAVKESDDEPGLDVFQTTQRNQDTPGAQKVTVSESTVRVEKINYDSRLMTLRGPDGKSITIEAGPEIKRFNEIKKGDMITMQMVKQTSIRVETPE